MKKFKELLFLKQLKGIGNASINRKYAIPLEKIESFEACVDMVRRIDAQIPESDIEKAIMQTEKKFDEIFNDLSISVITIFDENYPTKFRDLKEKKPVILYVKGNAEILEKKNIAVVGTRHPSEWSMKVEDRLVRKIIQLSDRTVISGLALGCDKIAHEATLQVSGGTIAVMPSGVNVITPASHKKLAQQIIEQKGCLISEYEPSAKVTKSTYVERDALIAALADATLVIECDVQSGTMHTVEAAEKMNRELACYYCDDSSKGKYAGNYYIAKEKDAHKISDTDDLTIFLRELDEKKVTNEEQETKQMSFDDLFRNSAKEGE